MDNSEHKLNKLDQDQAKNQESAVQDSLQDLLLHDNSNLDSLEFLKTSDKKGDPGEGSEVLKHESSQSGKSVGDGLVDYKLNKRRN